MKAYLIHTQEDSRHLSSILFPLIFAKEYGQKIIYEQLPRDKHGKFFPIDGIHFSISHSGNYWCALFSNQACGIDIEKLRSVNPRLRPKILSQEEQIANDDLLKTWVLKEAYSKLDGRGIGLDFSSISVKTIRQQYIVTDLSDDDYICYAIGTSKVQHLLEMSWDGQNLTKIPHKIL